MQQPMQPILQHLFQVSSLEDLNRQQIEAFVEQYPAFGIGHYLLSRKLKTEDPERYVTETQKTSLYFSNPFWLQWQLDHVVMGGNGVKLGEPVFVKPEEPVVTEVLEPEPAIVEEPAVVGNVVTVAEESFELPTTGDDLAEALSRPAVETAEETSAADRLLRSIEEARGLRESLHKINDDFSVETGVAGEAAGEEEPIKDEEAPFVLQEEVEPEEDEPVVTPEAPVFEEPVIAEPVAEPVVVEPLAAAPELEIAAPAVVAEPEPLVFEPYHTIDYFASQGIKLTLDENPSDALGKQLKSFTEWLKSMRRLPRQDREVVPDRVAEEAVQTIAQHSIEGRDILTETMAEVLAKQGMRERARAVYEKLSLLNPDKSAYFATKIEQLNIP